MPLFISNLILLEGWRRLGLAFAAGLLASISMPPLDWFPLLWICVPLLVWLLDSASLGKSPKAAARSMAWVGWMFGFGYFLVTFHWLGEAFLVEADKFAWAMPLAILVLPAGLALFWAAACGMMAFVWTATPVRILWLALALSGVEWLRGIVFTGLPWGGFGQALAATSVTMQALSLIGPNVYTLFGLLLFAVPALIFSEPDDRMLGRGLAATFLVLFAVQIGFGVYRLAQDPPATPDAPVVRLVQPNIAQRDKWVFENRAWIFNRLLALTSYDSAKTPVSEVDYVIWPESALPFFLMEQPGALAAIAAALPEKASLITGALRRQPGLDDDQDVYNSVYLLGPDGTVIDSYDKMHLVPFGEYLPKERWLQALGLEQLTAQKSGFAAGSRHKLLDTLDGTRLLPLVCYEIAFSREILQFPDGADWIVNVTNDAWFGTSTGPSQHLHLARMRAVETGLPIIRVANTGISAVIDAKGHILRQIPLETEGIVQEKLPARLKKPFYAQWGGWIFLTIWAFFGVATQSISRKVNLR